MERASVVEAQHQFGPHPHATALPADEPDDVGVPAARRHEVDDGDRAVRCFDARFEDQGVVAVAAGDASVRIRGFDQPAAVFRRRRATPQSTRRNRTAASRASQSIPPETPARRSRSRR